MRGGWRDGSSDVDLVLVLADDPASTLEAIGPALELARFSARIETMILVAGEIERSADCFPLLYSDIARASVTLAGTSPFETLVVPDHHKRVRIEQELRETRIRMRRVATDMARHQNFGGAVERKLKQARAPLGSLLELRGEVVADSLDAILTACGTAYAIDVAPLRRVTEDAKLAFQTLARLLDAALADVDAREQPRKE
ncbi:MAG: nucleotidyltransferase domain-containing protein [Proteobacteria bacterium]|nr:nucleotidyltransferase domain-containing protein [Pseudomonadota bacterium]